MTKAMPKTTRKLGRPPKSVGPSSRDQILDAALDLFSTCGYAATSVKQIAEQVGLRDSALYSHFASKAAIHAELFQIYGPNAVRLAWSTLNMDQGTLDPKGFVKVVLHQLAERWMRPAERKFFRLLLMENLQSEAAPLVHIGQMQEQLRDKLSQLSAMLIAQGKLLPVDPKWLAELFISPVLALRIDVAFRRDELDLAEVMSRLDQHVDHFFSVFKGPAMP